MRACDFSQLYYLTIRAKKKKRQFLIFSSVNFFKILQIRRYWVNLQYHKFLKKNCRTIFFFFVKTKKFEITFFLSERPCNFFFLKCWFEHFTFFFQFSTVFTEENLRNWAKMLHFALFLFHFETPCCHSNGSDQPVSQWRNTFNILSLQLCDNLIILV